MALPVTEQLTNQMRNESVGEIPTTPMEGNVTRSGMIGDLINAMKDVHFSQLLNEYGNIAGIVSADKKPLTTALMAEREQKTPLKTATTPTKETQTAEAEPIQTEEIKVPTPMSDAMAMTNLSPIKPTGSVVEQNNGLMTKSKGLQETV